MRKLLVSLGLSLLASPLFAQTTTIRALPNATSVVGTDDFVCDQTVTSAGGQPKACTGTQIAAFAQDVGAADDQVLLGSAADTASWVAIPDCTAGMLRYTQATNTWSCGATAYFTTGDEINDLSAAVTWANIPNANVPETAVTQHVGALVHDSLSGGTTDDAHFDHADDLTELNAQISSGLVTGAHTDDFDGLLAAMTLDESTSISTGAYGLEIIVANPSSDAVDINGTGAFSGDLFHVHQHTGNPSGGAIGIFEWEDADVDPLTVAVNSAGVASGTEEVGILITTDDNDDADYVPLLIQDDSGGTPDDLFKIDQTGAIEVGTIASGSATFTPDDGGEWTGSPAEVDAALEDLAPRVVANTAKTTFPGFDTVANDYSEDVTDDDLSDDLITALSGVTTVTDGSFCQGDAASAMNCDVAPDAGTDVTVDLEEEAHAGEHANGGGDAVDHDTLTNFVAAEHYPHRQHADDCGSETGGVTNETCWQANTNTWYVCESGPCNGSGWVSATAAGDGVGYDTVEDNDSAETQRAILNFLSGGTVTVVCADDVDTTDCTFTGSAHDGTGTDDQTAAEVTFTGDDGLEWTDVDPTNVDEALENLAPRVLVNDAKVTFAPAADPVTDHSGFLTSLQENGGNELLGETQGTACTENQIWKADATGGMVCAADAGGAETNTLTTMGGVADMEIALGASAGVGAYLAVTACAADEKPEFADSAPNTFTCEPIGGLVDGDIGDISNLATGAVDALTELAAMTCTGDQYLARNTGNSAWECVAEVAGGGTVTDVGDCNGPACFAGAEGATLTFETAGAADITLAAASSAAGSAITLPDETGTVFTRSTDLTNHDDITTITDGSFCQGGATNTLDCDVLQTAIPGTGHIDAPAEISADVVTTGHLDDDTDTPAEGEIVSVGQTTTEVRYLRPPPVVKTLFDTGNITTSDDVNHLHLWGDAVDVKEVKCMTSGGTSATITLDDGTNTLLSGCACATTLTTCGSLTNTTFTDDEQLDLDITAVSGSVTTLTIKIEWAYDN